jgi:hypothetical protein
MAGRTTNALVGFSNRNGCAAARVSHCNAPWKAFLFCLLALTLPGPVRSQDSLRIESVGLGNYYSFTDPTPVRVHIPVVSHGQSIELEFLVRSGNSPWHREISRTDRFSQHVEAAAGQALEIEAPILITQANWRELQVTASTADGQVIGSVSRDLKDLTSLANGPFLVAVYCTDDAICRNVQSQIAFGENGASGSRMNQNLRLTTFRDARTEWWAYRVAQTVVVAGPISGFSSDELQALENFTRGGGGLVVLEEETADKDFLAAYRQGAPTPMAIQVGRGRLFRARSVVSDDLGRIFSSGMAGRIGRETPLLPLQASADPFLTRIGVAFAFPRLRWLTIWLAVYLLVVGPLNFAILRRIKRLEWGWASVCVLAAVFTVGFYISGSARRPKNYTVDNATIYSLDDRSPVAVEYVALRASAPKWGDVRISVNDGALVVSTGGGRFSQSQGDGEEGVDIGAAMTDKARIQKGWDVELGTPLIIRTPMLRWSFQDWDFEGIHKFPGTVHWTPAGKLKNETGVSFAEAVYFDFAANKQYRFSQVAAGQEIELAQVTASDIWERIKMSNDQFQESLRIVGGRHDGSFSITEVPSWSYQVPKIGHLFAGLSDEPVSGVEMRPAGEHRATKAVTIVYLGEK